MNATLAMWMMNKPEWILIFIAFIGCIINGGAQPAFGIVLTKTMTVSLNDLYETLYTNSSCS